MPPNCQNRTMWTGDNLDIMRRMNSKSVDLTYFNPPFNANRNDAGPSAPKRPVRYSRTPGR